MGGKLELADRAESEAGLCPDCTVDHFEMLSEDGRFYATCPACGKRGPEAGSLYEATEGWKQMFRVPARSMSQMVWMVAGGFCLLAVVIAVIGIAAN